MAQTTFTWTGVGGTMPWYDESNWDVTGPPNQTDSGGSGNRLGTEEEDTVVIFDSETAENGYMPTETLQVSTDWFGSGASDHLMPALQLQNGILNLGNSNDVWWHYAGGNVYEIGDGDLAAVNAAIGDSFINNTDEDLLVQDNGDGTFTIKSGGTMPILNDLKITSIEVSDGLATIAISGREGVDYWFAGSSDLTAFEIQVGLFADPELINLVASPFQTTGETITSYLNTGGSTKMFYLVQEMNPGP